MKLVRILAAGAPATAALFSFQALAAQTQAQAALPPSPVSFVAMLQVLLGLALVLAAVAGSAWLLRRLSPGQAGAGGAMKIVGGLAVGPKERVVLVEIGETWLVLGVATGQVTTLHTLSRLEEFGSAQETPAGERRFSAWLKDVMSRRAAGQGE